MTRPACKIPSIKKIKPLFFFVWLGLVFFFILNTSKSIFSLTSNICSSKVTVRRNTALSHCYLSVAAEGINVQPCLCSFCLSGRKLLLHGFSAGGVFSAARDPPRDQLPAGPHHAHHHLPSALQRLPPHRPRGQSRALGVTTEKRIFN